MKKILEKKIFWIGGTAVAFSGVIVVRLIGPAVTGPVGKAVLIFGYLLALTGIFIIASSTKDRAIAMKTENVESHRTVRSEGVKPSTHIHEN
jgi:hypothetical protein